MSTSIYIYGCIKYHLMSHDSMPFVTWCWPHCWRSVWVGTAPKPWLKCKCYRETAEGKKALHDLSKHISARGLHAACFF